MMFNTFKNNILEAALLCLQHHGFHALSIEEIAQKAQITPSEIIQLFHSKEAIIESLIDNSLARLRELLVLPFNASHPQQTVSPTHFFKCLSHYCSQFKNHLYAMVLLSLQLTPQSHPALVRKIKDYFDEWQLAFSQGLPFIFARNQSNVIVESSVCLLVGTILRDLLAQQTSSSETIADVLFRYWMG